MPTIPIDALKQTDDDGKDLAPEVGDVVDLGNASVKVVAIDGDNAEVELASVNGAPCDDGDGADDEGAGDDDSNMGNAVDAAGMDAMKKKLMAAAAAEDKQAGRD